MGIDRPATTHRHAAWTGMRHSMGHKVSDIAFTPAVKAVQEQKGSRAAYERMAEKGGWSDTVTDELATFIAARDSFYFATASADGQPYVQHRGGPAGFL